MAEKVGKKQELRRFFQINKGLGFYSKSFIVLMEPEMRLELTTC